MSIRQNAMQNAMKILFYLRKNYVNRDGEVSIMVRLTINKEITQFSSKVTINPKMWSVKSGRAKGRAFEAIQINAKLDNITTLLHNNHQEMTIMGDVITAEKVKNVYLGLTKRRETLLEIFKDHNEAHEKQIGVSITRSTVQKYILAYNIVEEYIKTVYHQKDILITSVNHQFIVGFDGYLRTKCKYGENTTAKVMQRLKKIVLIAQNSGLLPVNPFSNHKICFKKVDRGYLTQKEVKAIMSREIRNKRLEQVRDLFVFACFTGLAYIDVKNLTPDNIQLSFDDRLWIKTFRQKTGTESNILLLDTPKKIIDKYKGICKDGKLLPMISNQKMNNYLKEIADVCGIQKNLTYHLARHTFATTITLAKGVPIETVSKMLGHTKISTTQIYARITDSKVGDDMAILSSKLNRLDEALNIS